MSDEFTVIKLNTRMGSRTFQYAIIDSDLLSYGVSTFEHGLNKRAKELNHIFDMGFSRGRNTRSS